MINTKLIILLFITFLSGCSFVKKTTYSYISNPDLYNETALRYYESGNIKKAVDIAGKACEEGRSYECILLADFYQKGEIKSKGFNKDLEKAFTVYFQNCSMNNNPEACFKISQFYKQGIGGVQKNNKAANEYKEKAIVLFEKQCNDNTNFACRMFALKYINNEIMDLDANPLSLLQKACDNKDGQACVILGDLQLQINKSGIDYYNKACSLNNSTGCVNLFNYYMAENRKTSDKYMDNIKKLVKKLDKMCFSGFADACSAVADFYEVYGRLHPLDNKTPFMYIEQSCKYDNKYGCNRLGDLFSIGKYVTANKSISNRYYIKSCNLGYKPACSKVRKY